MIATNKKPEILKCPECGETMGIRKFGSNTDYEPTLCNKCSHKLAELLVPEEFDEDE